MPRRVASIVEGHGEVKALPELVRRIAYAHGVYDLVVLQPHRLARDKILKPVELSRAVRLQAARVGEAGGLLVLFDADDGCPVDLAHGVVDGIARLQVPCQVRAVVANREFESVFLATLDQLSGRSGVKPGQRPAEAPETLRDAKKLLRQAMTVGAYSETVDQVALTSSLDIALASERCRWFRTLRDAIVTMIQ